MNERWTGSELEAFRKRCRVSPDGHTPTAQEFADSIGVALSTYESWIYEKRGTLIPAPCLTLLRITWDALHFAQWQQQRPKHGRIKMETTITLNGHEYTASIARGPEDTKTSISICMDNIWAGNGTLRHAGKGVYVIDDCAAALGEEVYEALGEAISDEFAEVDPA